MMRERQRPTTSAVHHHNHHHNSNGASIDNNSINNDQHDAKSATSYRSTKSSRSSVLERAKEYNRRIDEQNRRRAKSLERQSDTSSTTPSQQTTPRSASVGRVLSHHHQNDNHSNNNHHYPAGNRPSTRERALASVRKEERMVNNSFSSEMSRSQYSGDNSHHPNHHNSNGRSGGGGGGENGNGGRSDHARNHQTASRQREVLSLSSPQPAQQRSQGPSAAIAAVAPATTPGSAYSKQSRKDDGRAQQQQQQLATRDEYTANRTNKPSPSRSLKSSQHTRDDTHRQQQEAVVTPELLVDALSGHEDGLLAIAERLMEHYDNGYDVMGEAIIDAFADVQKLFQHVVEAAHMEGAAFEASRRESEMAELRKQAAQGGILSPDDLVSGNGDHPTNLASPSGPSRHDEFIDQDVKDVLTEAIRKGTSLRDANKHQECYQMYEHACQSASSLLPVDSDHRGRLQLSLARAESMNAERACAILRYAMDDVLRSGLRAGRAPLPDPSKRADVVLSKPRDVTSSAPGQAGVIQSSEEALASLVEEMKEMISAPAYDNTPLQGVAERFWHALGEAQKAQLKNEERLEHNLGKLKGDFLLARAEWEEKLNAVQEQLEIYKRKYNKLKESRQGEHYMEQARSVASKFQEQRMDDRTFESLRSVKSNGAGSVASLGSGLAQQARTLVGSFACGNNERTGGIVAAELSESHLSYSSLAQRRSTSAPRTPADDSYSYGPSISTKPSNQNLSSAPSQDGGSLSSRPRRSKSSRSFREYHQSPQRVDV